MKRKIGGITLIIPSPILDKVESLIIIIPFQLWIVKTRQERTKCSVYVSNTLNKLKVYVLFYSK